MLLFIINNIILALFLMQYHTTGNQPLVTQMR